MLRADASKEIEKAVEIARKYGVWKLYLIGSSLRKNPETANDYDFAVADVPSGAFFKFYAELFRTLSKNVDLINLSGKVTRFTELVISEGRLIYDREAS